MSTTIYFRGLDNLIATARSDTVAVCLGFQIFSINTGLRWTRKAKVIQNTVVIYSVVAHGSGETPKSLSERFGKVFAETPEYDH